MRDRGLYSDKHTNRNRANLHKDHLLRIYLDHAATTPIRPEALAAMQQAFALWANPSSPHAEGRKAKQALEDARVRVKNALGWDGEVIFTSGASEAAELALDRAKGSDRLVSAVEHDAIRKAAPKATIIPVDGNGALNLEAIDRAQEAEGAEVVAVQTINSETGNAQDIATIAAQVHAADGVLLADCSQSAGKYPIPAGADMAIVSAHKLGGPPGIGALLVRDFAMLEPAGGQERGYRRGTENLPGVLGFAAALEACGEAYIDPSILSPFGQILAPAIERLGGVRLSERLSDPTPFVHAFAMPGISGSAQLMRFDMAGIAVSQGSACSSGTLKTSHVLEAMGVDDDLASRMIRVSVGWSTTREEVERFCATWIEMAEAAA